MGRYKFSDGNVPEAWNNFPRDHCCNAYCTFFELPSTDFKGRMDWELAADGLVKPVSESPQPEPPRVKTPDPLSSDSEVDKFALRILAIGGKGKRKAAEVRSLISLVTRSYTLRRTASHRKSVNLRKMRLVRNPLHQKLLSLYSLVLGPLSDPQ